jgi:hypothetical protein
LCPERKIQINMIREDRVQLNDRFRSVFKLLLERGDIVLNDRNGKGMGDFAGKILGNKAYGHIIRAFLNPNDKRVIDYGHARKLCRAYGVNESYMIDGVGTPFGLDISQHHHSSVPNSKVGNIMYTSVEALAGTGADVGGSSQVEEKSLFSFPGLEGTGLVAFPIEGNSMIPVVHHGDIIICRSLEGVHEIKDNDIYAIRTDHGVWVKYVQKLMDKKGRVHRLKLISANYLEYEPFEEEINEWTRVYKVIKKVSSI